MRDNVIYSFITVLLAYWCMTLGLEGWFNGILNPFKRILSIIGSVFLLIPPQEFFYIWLIHIEISGYFLNGFGLLILIFIYFVQGKLNFKTENST